MKQPFGVKQWALAALGGIGTTVAVACPAFADNLAILVYPVVIWPVGALLALIQLVLIIWSLWSLRAKRPAWRLGLATAITAAVAGLIYPPFVFILGISRYADLNVMTVSPVVLLALIGVTIGLKIRRA